MTTLAIEQNATLISIKIQEKGAASVHAWIDAGPPKHYSGGHVRRASCLDYQLEPELLSAGACQALGPACPASPNGGCRREEV